MLITMKEKVSNAQHPVISSYIPLVEFLGKFIGLHCEVVLHDLTIPERSVISIHNGHISGRAAGAPLTDFALRLIKNNVHTAADYLHEYEGTLKTGKRVRSSTFFIKDESDGLIGLLCFNRDTSKIQETRDTPDGMHATYSNYNAKAVPNAPDAAASPGFEESETFSASIDELINVSIARALAPFNLPPERLSLREREEVIDALYRKGFFHLRGAVEHVAAVFGLSEATIYRCLKSVQRRSA